MPQEVTVSANCCCKDKKRIPMRVLHIVKTSDGARWAAAQARNLVEAGLEVHVALPSLSGAVVKVWQESGCVIHVANLCFPSERPWELPMVCLAARRLVDDVVPDLIHSHFVSTTMLVRVALGPYHPVPRLFQVPGPLHLEHWAPRAAEIITAGPRDYWIGSSRCIVERYRNAGVPCSRVFLSYYGLDALPSVRSGYLRNRLKIPRSQKIVGNINLIYPPKVLLGQRVGLKGHEDVIDALELLLRDHDDVVGVLIGSTFGAKSTDYEDALRKRAVKVGGGRILMPGRFNSVEVMQSWADFDCAVHVPHSENCGGVVEPLLAAVPTVAAEVGGLPEVVVHNRSGLLVPVRSPKSIAAAVSSVLGNPNRFANMARAGQSLVMSMFDLKRTSGEVFGIYKHILEGAPRPVEFDSGRELESIIGKG